MTPYEVLGISPDATNDEIEKAYKRAANKTHPDKAGGSEEAFRAVKAAYDELMGVLPDDIDRLLRAVLQSVIVEYPLNENLISCALRDIDDSRMAAAKRIAGHQKQLARFNQVKGRVVGPPLLQKLLDDAIDDVQLAIKNETDWIARYMRVRSLLKDYSDIHTPVSLPYGAMDWS